MMPVMNGWAFLEARAKIPELSRIPVIVMSGAANNLPQGAGVTLLPKPVDFSQLIDTLEALPRLDALSRQSV